VGSAGGAARIRETFERGQPLHGARMATCPECEFDEIDTEDFEEGDTLSCPECGKSLVMTGADELDVANDDDEDLDDDLEEEEEEDDDEDADVDDEDEVEDEEDFDE
jgi:alpha-aminoadipate/glutamate carrier protein LysW